MLHDGKRNQDGKFVIDKCRRGGPAAFATASQETESSGRGDRWCMQQGGCVRRDE